MLLLDYARETVGLPMRGLHLGAHIGWTTNEEKAEKMALAGARRQRIHNGWDISFAVDAEVEEDRAA